MLRVWVSIRTTFTEIPRSLFQCQEHTASVQELGDANVCLHVHESPKNRLSESSLTQVNLIPGVFQLKTPVSIPYSPL